MILVLLYLQAAVLTIGRHLGKVKTLHIEIQSEFCGCRHIAKCNAGSAICLSHLYAYALACCHITCRNVEIVRKVECQFADG